MLNNDEDTNNYTLMQLFPVIKKTTCKAANLCDKRGCLLPFISKDDVWILLFLNFNYETKYKSSHIV